MPTYVYRCEACDHAFDVFAKITTRPRARKCPVCGGRAERQISGGAGFLFKGEGFYVTDHRSEEYRKKAEKEKPPKDEPKPASKDKPASRPDGKTGDGGDAASKGSSGG